MNMIYSSVITALLQGGEAWLYTCLEGENVGEMAAFVAGETVASSAVMLYKAKEYQGLDHGAIVRDGDTCVFCEHISPLPQVCILGGGLVSLPLARFTDILGFIVTVIDPDEGLANYKRFPMAACAIAGDYADGIRRIGNGANKYYILITNKAKSDYDCLDIILRGEYAYVGIVGTSKRIRPTLDRLAGNGMSKAALRRVHTAVGININSRTPDEYALSIAAELVKEKNERVHEAGFTKHLIDGMQRTSTGVMATLLNTRGAAQRTVGARMLISGDGTTYGSIDAGSHEAQVREYARIAREKNACGFFRCGTSYSGIDVFISPL